MSAPSLSARAARSKSWRTAEAIVWRNACASAAGSPAPRAPPAAFNNTASGPAAKPPEARHALHLTFSSRPRKPRRFIAKLRLPGAQRRQGCGDGGLLSPGLRQVERRGDSVGETCIHKLLVLFGDAQITLCNPKKVLRSAQLHVALRQFGDRRERDAMAVLHGSYGDSALFHSLDDEKINVVQIKCTVTVTLEQVCNFGGGLRPEETAWNR